MTRLLSRCCLLVLLVPAVIGAMPQARRELTIDAKKFAFTPARIDAAQRRRDIAGMVGSGKRPLLKPGERIAREIAAFLHHELQQERRAERAEYDERQSQEAPRPQRSPEHERENDAQTTSGS